MKKTIPIIIICILLLSGIGVITQAYSNNTYEKITFNFSQPRITNENKYFSISLNEANSFLMNQGKPKLPCYTETFTFPFGTKIKSVTVTPKNIQLQTLMKDILPTPQRVIVGQDITTSDEVLKDYGIDLYPSTWYEYNVGCGRQNGEICVIVNLQIYPIQYQPKEKIIQWAKEVYVEIEHETTISTPQPMLHDDFQLIVIGPSEYNEQVLPLIIHKTTRGITSKFVSLEEIYGGTYFLATGRDNQEKIKYFIKNTIENWGTSNILLIGGSNVLPVRETHVYISDTDTEIFVSDLYYADIYNKTGDFSSWDSNNNDIFGEYKWNGQTDVIDLYPDVFLTRLPSTSTNQITSYINKIITYENNPGYQQDWFSNLVVVGGDTFEDDDKVNEGEYANQKVIDIMTGFTPTKIWATNEQLTSITPTGIINIKSAINNGCGFIDFSGHGNTNVWASHPPDNHNIWIPTPKGRIVSTDLTDLNNGDKLPILTVEACSTAKFNKDANCFNWAFLSSSNGGAIGTFGATGLGYGYIGSGYTQGLIGKIGLDVYRSYKLDQVTSFGELWAASLNRYIKSHMDEGDYKTVEEWQAFGDPTLAIGEKSQAPQKPTTPDGESSGKIGKEYTYTTSTTDPDGDDISYMFDWGDGTFSAWIGPLSSGETVSAKKIWENKGTYEIRVIAKDIHGITSVWSDATPISMPLSYHISLIQFLQLLYERFLLLFPIVQFIFT